MCRFLAYQGSPVLLENIVSKPCHSLVHQSFCAEEAKTPTNGDGFGLGWYGERNEPGIYRDLRPAWSDENLLSICAQVRSRLFFAHVRAATGTATSRANCHPFSYKNCLFMHNGQVGGYGELRRAIEKLIPDHLYKHRHGTTDSEAIFLAAIGMDAEKDPITAFNTVLNQVYRITHAAKTDEALRFSAIFTNGEALCAFRWACDGKAPTLYWRYEEGNLQVVSEPIDACREVWQALPQNSALRAYPHSSPEIIQFNPICE